MTHDNNNILSRSSDLLLRKCLNSRRSLFMSFYLFVDVYDGSYEVERQVRMCYVASPHQLED